MEFRSEAGSIDSDPINLGELVSTSQRNVAPHDGPSIHALSTRRDMVRDSKVCPLHHDSPLWSAGVARALVGVR